MSKLGCPAIALSAAVSESLASSDIMSSMCAARTSVALLALLSRRIWASGDSVMTIVDAEEASHGASAQCPAERGVASIDEGDEGLSLRQLRIEALRNRSNISIGPQEYADSWIDQLEEEEEKMQRELQHMEQDEQEEQEVEKEENETDEEELEEADIAEDQLGSLRRWRRNSKHSVRRRVSEDWGLYRGNSKLEGPVMTLYHTTSRHIARLILEQGFKSGNSGWCGGAIYFIDRPYLKKSKFGRHTQRGAILEAQVQMGKMGTNFDHRCKLRGVYGLHSHGVGAAKAHDFDSIRFNPGDGPEFIIWNPEQVKTVRILRYS